MVFCVGISITYSCKKQKKGLEFESRPLESSRLLSRGVGVDHRLMYIFRLPTRGYPALIIFNCSFTLSRSYQTWPGSTQRFMSPTDVRCITHALPSVVAPHSEAIPFRLLRHERAYVLRFFSFRPPYKKDLSTDKFGQLFI
jgi:hypothetical protein